MRKKLLALAVALIVPFAAACSSDEGGGSGGGEDSVDCDELFQELDEFRRAHQEEVIAGEPETDEELVAYQEERDRLIQQYEDAGCGSIAG